jgi:branched-chain amino acid transport system permease protein
VALLLFLLLGLTGAAPLFLLIVALIGVMILAMALTAVWGWTIERLAYRPLRGSFRLAPLITAIGMSIVLSNMVQISQGARIKNLPPDVKDKLAGGFTVMEANGFAAVVSYRQLVIVCVTFALMAFFTWIIQSTSLGRAQRACEQDRTMAALTGVDVDRTISLTFVIGAGLAAVAGVMFLVYYGSIDFHIGFVAGIKAFTAAVLGGIGSLPGAMLGGLLIGFIEVFWSGYVGSAYKDVAAFSILAIVLIFRPEGLLGRPEIEKV